MELLEFTESVLEGNIVEIMQSESQDSNKAYQNAIALEELGLRMYIISSNLI